MIIVRLPKSIKFAFAAFTLTLGLAEADSPLAVVDHPSGDRAVQWTASVGWEYELESANDLRIWQSEGVWTGTGGLIDLTVFEALPGGGNPPAAGPMLPTHTFSVVAYDDGNSLISWIGQDGQA